MRLFLATLALSSSFAFAQGIDLGNIPSPRDFPKNWPGSNSTNTATQRDIALITSAPEVHQFAKSKGDEVNSVFAAKSAGVYVVATNGGCAFEVWSLGNNKYSIRTGTWYCIY